MHSSLTAAARRLAGGLGFAAALTGVSACAPEIGGRASFPLLGRTTLPNYYEPITVVDEKRCNHNLLVIIAWGEDANHEALVTDILAKHKGEAIIDANLTFFSIPALVYNQQCARVTGTVVKRSGAVPGSAQPPPVKALPGVP